MRSRGGCLAGVRSFGWIRPVAYPPLGGMGVLSYGWRRGPVVVGVRAVFVALLVGVGGIIFFLRGSGVS